jgi:hypothetical protein
MDNTAFVVHLSGNIYLDSDGKLITGAPQSVPVYKPPFQLPIEPSKVKDALDGVKKALKDINKDADVIQKFNDFGLPLKVLDILSGVGKVAGMVAPVFMVASFVVDALKLFGVFKNGPSALELLVKQRFDELENTVLAVAQLIVSQDLRNGRIDVENFSNAVKTHVAQLKNSNPTLAQLEADRTALFGLHDEHINGISKLLDQQTWLSILDRDEYTQVWGAIYPWLYTLPQGISAPQPAPLPPKGTVVFDHRLMVPLASMAAETYLACIRGISPEYRTTGDFRDQLRGLARKLDDLAQAMRQNVLARTIYKASDFAWPVLLSPYDVVWTGALPGLGEPVVSPKCSRWPVGALDLLYHDNTFFRDFLDALWKGEFFGWPHETKHGGLNFRWIPPAKLEQAEWGNWRITNPDECAAAANAQAEKDYADLLSVSGYTDLLQLSALFHQEATEPNRSQTVQPQKPSLYRDPQPSSATTVQSDDIFMTGVITSDATREPQKCMAYATVWTQPIKRPRPVQYQVRLRTLRSLSGKNRWHEATYDGYQWAEYEPDFANPGFFRLAITHTMSALDDKLLLPNWNSSPRDAPLHAEGVAELKAHTFDWWIPVKSPFSPFVDFNATLADLRGAGGYAPPQPKGGSGGLDPNLPRRQPDMLNRFVASQTRFAANAIQPAPMQVLSDEGQPGLSASYEVRFKDLIPELFWKSGDQDWDGQHRDVKEVTVSIEYELDWDADRLYFTLRNDPADRNYIVFLVVEEKFIGSGQILHTALPIPINGQLTYVPQKFFDDETAAIAKVARTIAEINRRFSESRQPGPIDPIVGWLNPGDMAREEVVAKFVEVAKEREPELLAQVMQEFGGG